MQMDKAAEVAFPRLSPEQIESLKQWGRIRSVKAGDILFEEGCQGYAFYVVLSGAVEILEGYNKQPHRITVHRAGEFVGDADLLSGRSSLVTAQVIESGEVLQLDTDAIRKVVSELPEISEVLLRAFMMRRTLLMNEDNYEGIEIIGSRYSPAAHRLREFATRNAVPFAWTDLEQSDDAEEILRHLGVSAADTPLVIGRRGEVFRNPSIADFASYLGFEPSVPAGEVYDLIIVGAGPAGLGGAVYAASEGLRTVVLDRVAAGGQAGTSSKIENYLGFPTGISGAELADRALLQSEKFGAVLSVPHTVTGLRSDGGTKVVTLEHGDEMRARSVLVASGVEYRQLDVPRLEEFEGAGVYYAASEMEARLCGGEDVVIVGGGNSAGQAAVFLSRSATHVHIVVRGADLGSSMSRYLVDRVEHTENITVHPDSEVVGLEGDERLSAVRVRNGHSGRETTIRSRALFIFIGAVPHTAWLRDCVMLDKDGFVLTGAAIRPETLQTDEWRRLGREPYFLETSLPGVFAAGDARSGSVKRVASAVGEGSMAVTFIHSYVGASADA